MRVVYDLVAFGFITPIKNAKRKKNANFRSRIQTLGKQILASVNFAPNRIGPSNIATTLEFVKKNQHLQQARHISYRQAGQHLRYSVGRVTTRVTPCKERNLCYLLEWTKRHLKPQLDCQWQATWIRLDLNILNPGQRREGTSSLLTKTNLSWPIN